MDYDDKVAVLKAYIEMKLEEDDYHAVADAANDLRVLAAEEASKVVRHTEPLRPFYYPGAAIISTAKTSGAQ